MPTGYTSDIYDGKEINGKDFIMQCARAFGACVAMKDESMDAEIPEEFKPSTYHKEQIKEIKEELKKYKNMNTKEIKDAIETEYKDKIEYNNKQIKECICIKNRYLNTLTDVLAWTPPTPDHIGLKEFAVNQLKTSMRHDCDISYYEEEVIKPTTKEWLNNKINRCLQDIEYHTRKNKEEIKRVTEGNKWIKDLRDSLKNK